MHHELGSLFNSSFTQGKKLFRFFKQTLGQLSHDRFHTRTFVGRAGQVWTECLLQ